MTGYAIVGAENVRIYRYLTLKHALKLEIRGLKISRGPSAYSIVKRELGFKGNKASVLGQLEEFLSDKYLKDIASDGFAES